MLWRIVRSSLSLAACAGVLSACTPDGASAPDGGSTDGAVGTDGPAPNDAGLPEAGSDASLVDSGASPSCKNLAHTCGPNGNGDCCASSVVSGGTYSRSYDGLDGGSYTDPQYTAKVSDFRLDTYEVTVGRFRAFVAGFPGNKPAVGAGKNPNDPTDPGWNGAWSTAGLGLATDQASLIAAIKCDVSAQTWTDTPGANESKPINCITWWEGFAFCVWDGGRLPTEAEWNYAAAGGSEQRAYPWSSPSTSTTIDAAHAIYSAATGVAAVGSTSPVGDGRWGQADLAGNVWEWTVDWDVYQYVMPCVDCAYRASSSGANRERRGGAYDSPADWLLVSTRSGYAPENRVGVDGVRCARSP